jgi:hypothetical protein
MIFVPTSSPKGEVVYENEDLKRPALRLFVGAVIEE